MLPILHLVTLLAHAQGQELDDRLARLVDDTKRNGSTALWIEQDGQVLVDWQRGRRDRRSQVMSCTKSIASLGVARLLDEGRIASLDLPLSTWFPESDGRPLGSVTLRQVMAATSGLEPCSDVRSCSGVYQEDRVGFALGSALTQEPGTWRYNNNAPNLLSGIVLRVTGSPLDAYLQSTLFEPLGIAETDWGRDERGATAVEAGLALTAPELARIGVLMLNGGTWQGQRLLSVEVIEALTRPQPEHPWYGLLWWPVYRYRWTVSEGLLQTWRSAGVGAETTDRLAPLVGRTYPSFKLCFEAEVEALGGAATGQARLARPAWEHLPLCQEQRELAGYSAQGSFGQYLVVLPRERVVAVRQRHIGRIYQEFENDPRDLVAWPEQIAAVFSPDGSVGALPPWAGLSPP